jgi:hypothetical protein
LPEYPSGSGYQWYTPPLWLIISTSTQKNTSEHIHFFLSLSTLWLNTQHYLILLYQNK